VGAAATAPVSPVAALPATEVGATLGATPALEEPAGGAADAAAEESGAPTAAACTGAPAGAAPPTGAEERDSMLIRTSSVGTRRRSRRVGWRASFPTANGAASN
jgi:hypothetical protein